MKKEHKNNKEFRYWTEKLDNGNFALYYDHLPVRKKWMAVVVGVLLAGMVVAEYICNATYTSVILAIFVYLWFLMWWSKRYGSDNEKLEEAWMNERIDELLPAELERRGKDVREIKRLFCVETKGYGTVVAEMMLVLLSDGDVLEYHLKYFYDNEKSYHELLSEPTDCTNEMRLKKIKPIKRKHTPLKNWGNHAYEEYKESLGMLIINSSLIKYLVMLSYLIYLAVSSFMTIHSGVPLINADVDNAVIKAFLVFIAYSNLVKQRSEIDINTETLKTIMVKMIIVNDDDNIEHDDQE